MNKVFLLSRQEEQEMICGMERFASWGFLQTPGLWFEVWFTWRSTRWGESNPAHRSWPRAFPSLQGMRTPCRQAVLSVAGRKKQVTVVHFLSPQAKWQCELCVGQPRRLLRQPVHSLQLLFVRGQTLSLSCQDPSITSLTLFSILGLFSAMGDTFIAFISPNKMLLFSSNVFTFNSCLCLIIFFSFPKCLP